MEVTMLFGFLPNNTLSVIGVAWTLGAIFSFYIIFPFIVFLLYNKHRAIMALLISLGVTFMCQTYFMTEKFVVKSFAMRHSFLFCLPYFLCGGLIYLYRNEVVKVVNCHKPFSFILCVVLTVVYFVIPDSIADFDFILIKTLLLYSSWICFALSDKNTWLSNKFTKFISGISMQMYLAHMVVFRVIEKLNVPKLLGETFSGYLATYTAVVMLLIAGIILYRKIEFQILRILTER